VTQRSKIVQTQKYGARLTPPVGLPPKMARDWARNRLVKMIEEAGHDLEGTIETHILPAEDDRQMQVAAVADVYVLTDRERAKLREAYLRGYRDWNGGTAPKTTPYDLPESRKETTP